MLNGCLIIPILGKMAYEIYYGKVLTFSHLKLFGSRCYILNKRFNYIYFMQSLKMNVVEESTFGVFDDVNSNKEWVIDYNEDDTLLKYDKFSKDNQMDEENSKRKEL